MSNGCAVVASNMIGAVPFIVEDGVNGLIFQSESIASLESKVESLLTNQKFRQRLAENAVVTMRTLWSPNNAAQQFLQLVQAINNHDISSVAKNGPCSQAERI